MARALGLLVIMLVCSAADTPPSNDIGGTGHIEPRGGVVVISGVGGATIRTIKVHAGQTVKRGDVLMVLDDAEPALEEKIAATALDRARHDAAQAVTSEQVSLKLAQLHYQEAKKEAQGYRELGPDATSLKQTITFDAALEDAQGALVVERKKYADIRAGAAADIDIATKRLQTAQVVLSRYRVTAPSDGVVLLVGQHEGETLAGAPAIEVGDISAMYVVCQIFQGDLLKIKRGMKATITSNALQKPLTGVVEEISHLILPTTQTGDVKIKLNDTALASRVVGMEVEVKIAL